MTDDDSMENSVSSIRYKIIFIGDAGVGKTTIISRIMNNPFTEEYEPSIGVDFMSKNLKYHGQIVKLQIWDTAGQEKYKGLIPSYIRNSSIVFIVYDISSKTSFDNIPKWINFVKSIDNTTLILCGNKIDLENREVKKEEGEEFAKKENIPFYEVSAKTEENIKDMFYKVICDLPTFADNKNKENLIKELMQEDGVTNTQEGIKADQSGQKPEEKIVVDGKEKPAGKSTKKKGCHC